MIAWVQFDFACLPKTREHHEADIHRDQRYSGEGTLLGHWPRLCETFALYHPRAGIADGELPVGQERQMPWDRHRRIMCG